MPIWLRKFTYNKIGEHYDKQKPQKDDIISTTQKYKEMSKINPAQFQQFQFNKKGKTGYSKK